MGVINRFRGDVLGFLRYAHVQTITTIVAEEKKMPAFLDSKIVLLLQLYRVHKDLLEAKFKTSITNQLKKSTGRKIADKLIELPYLF